MIEQIKCSECDKNENCNRVVEYCWREVELYAEKVKAEAVREFSNKLINEIHYVLVGDMPLATPKMIDKEIKRISKEFLEDK